MCYLHRYVLAVITLIAFVLVRGTSLYLARRFKASRHVWSCFWSCVQYMHGILEIAQVLTRKHRAAQTCAIWRIPHICPAWGRTRLTRYLEACSSTRAKARLLMHVCHLYGCGVDQSLCTLGRIFIMATSAEEFLRWDCFGFCPLVEYQTNSIWFNFCILFSVKCMRALMHWRMYAWIYILHSMYCHVSCVCCRCGLESKWGHPWVNVHEHGRLILREHKHVIVCVCPSYSNKT
jgi:hypothetical protein